MNLQVGALWIPLLRDLQFILSKRSEVSFCSWRCERSPESYSPRMNRWNPYNLNSKQVYVPVELVQALSRKPKALLLAMSGSLSKPRTSDLALANTKTLNLGPKLQTWYQQTLNPVKSNIELEPSNLVLCGLRLWLTLVAGLIFQILKDLEPLES